MSAIKIKRIFRATRSASNLNVIRKSASSVLSTPFAVIVIILSMSSFNIKGQGTGGTAEVEIRKLESEQVNLLMSGALSEMKKNWAPNFTVNNPFNVVQDAATGPIQSGALTYKKFERNIEKILTHDSVVIVMGSELVVPKTAPKGSSHDTDQPIKRRFTNVWMRKDGKWLIIARHASNVCSN
jgi:hypothetical protein